MGCFDPVLRWSSERRSIIIKREGIEKNVLKKKYSLRELSNSSNHSTMNREDIITN